MTDFRCYLETGDKLKDAIRKRVPVPKLDGLTTSQRQAELDMTTKLERLNAKILADGELWHQRQRRNHGLETAGRMRARAVREDISATVL